MKNTANQERYEIICVGFGPSNLAIAIALEEMAPDLHVVFVEAQEKFGWHTGMLFAQANMQISYLKDLVTFRNPLSKYSFVNFLHTKGRLAAFTNLGSFTPTRREFHQYLEWCAAHFSHKVRYGTRVTAIEATHDETVARVHITTADGLKTLRAPTIVHATGLAGVVPQGIETGQRILHCHNLVNHFATNPPKAHNHFTVVGGGQSAAETVRYLLSDVPHSKVTASIAQFGYVPADDTPFVNEIFNPEHVDTFFSANNKNCEAVLKKHAATNYAAVDAPLIEELYRYKYDQMVSGEARLAIHRCQRLLSAKSDGATVRMTFQDELTGATNATTADWLICATGFSPQCPGQLLKGSLGEKFRQTQNNEQPLTRGYRVNFGDETLPDIYTVQNSERSHGPTATLISNMAVRAGEIVTDILDRRSGMQKCDASPPCTQTGPNQESLSRRISHVT